MYTNKRCYDGHGLTLIERMIVVAIAGGLGMLAISGVRGFIAGASATVAPSTQIHGENELE